MGRMKDVYTELVTGIQSVDLKVDELIDLLNFNVDDVKCLRQSVDDTNNRINGLLHLMADMVKLEDQIKSMEENIEQRLARMEAAQMDSCKLVDRMIEMTLVQAGQPDQAVLHRAQSRLDTGFFDRSTESVEQEEDVWPPPGCDAMESRG